MKLINATLLILLSNLFFGFSQYPDWKSYTHGKDVQCLAKEGNILWVGTTGGLVKIDLVTGAKNFFTKENSGLPDVYITCIAIDANGNKWVGTGNGGLALFDGYTWINYNTTNSSITSNSISDLCFGKNNELWIGQTGGLDRLSGSIWTRFDQSNSPIQHWAGSVFAVSCDSSGVLFVGTSSGLMKYDGVSWKVYSRANSGIQNDRIYDIVIDKNNTLWAASPICNGVGGLIQLIDTTFTVFFAGTLIERLCLDDYYNVWFSQCNSINKFDGLNLTTFNNYNTQINNICSNNVLLTDSGRVWFATFPFSELKIFDGTYYVRSYSTSKYNIELNSVQSFAINHSDSILMSFQPSQDCYVCPPNGINILSQNSFTLLNTANSPILTNEITTIAIDSQNVYWMGTKSKGIISYNGTIWTFYDSLTNNLPTNSLSGNNSFAFDSKHNVWAALRPVYDTAWNPIGGGLAKFDGTNWMTIVIDSVPYNLISGIAIDHSDNLWLACYNEIRKFDGRSWTIYPITIGWFSSIAVDLNDDIWLGTSSGLIKISNGVETNYTSTNSALPCDYITAITVDKDNNLWLGLLDFEHDNMLSKFDRSTFTNYTILNSGLSGFMTVQVIAKDNKIYIATDNGFTVFTDLTITNINNVMTDLMGSIIKSIYPNPCFDKINIKYDLKNDAFATLEIFNSTNQKIIDKTLNTEISGIHTIEIDTKLFSPGIYYCKIKSANNVRTEKFIVLNNPQ